MPLEDGIRGQFHPMGADHPAAGPQVSAIWSSSRATRSPDSEISTTAAKHPRPKSSITFRIRKRRPAAQGIRHEVQRSTLLRLLRDRHRHPGPTACLRPLCLRTLDLSLRVRSDTASSKSHASSLASAECAAAYSRTGPLQIHQRFLQPAPKAIGLGPGNPLGFRSPGRISEKRERHQNVTGSSRPLQLAGAPQSLRVCIRIVRLICCSVIWRVSRLTCRYHIPMIFMVSRWSAR